MCEKWFLDKKNSWRVNKIGREQSLTGPKNSNKSDLKLNLKFKIFKLKKKTIIIAWKKLNAKKSKF